MMKCWRRWICHGNEVPKPIQPPITEGIGKKDPAELSPGSGPSSPVRSCNEEKTKPSTDIEQLKDRLEEINEAIKRVRQRGVKRHPVSTAMMNNVDDAEKVLSSVSTLGENINTTQPSGTEELRKILCDALEGAGKLHWAATGLSMVAYVLNRVDLVKQNSVECLDLLELLRDLGEHVVTLYPHFSDQDEKLQRAICLITEGANSCLDYLNRGIVRRFGFANGNKDILLSVRKNMARLTTQMTLINFETMVTQNAELKRLATMPLSSLESEDLSNKVGLEKRVDALLRILGMKDTQGLETGVRAVVLHGMGGIGKSTLGSALQARLPFKDRAYAKVEIGEKATNEKILECQKQILERLSGQKMAIGLCSEGKQKLESYLQKCTVPILLFVDNIFRREDLRNLLPDNLVLPGGSCIIVTSRDESVWTVLKDKGVDCHPYPVAELEKAEATELLCKQVFNGDSILADKEALVTDLLEICGGLPLALELVGRHLKWHNTDAAWKSAIKSLRECKPVDGTKEDQLIQTLMFSYNQLSEDCQKAFLDIACLLKNFRWDLLVSIYEQELVTLEALALVSKLDEGDGHVWPRVHDLLVALGRNVQHGTRIQSDGKDILPGKAACGIVEGLNFKNCSIHAKALDAMHESLRIVVLDNVAVVGRCSRNADNLKFLYINSAGVPFKDLSKMSQLRVLMIIYPTDFEFENVKFPKDLEVLRLEKVGSLKCLPRDFFEELTSLRVLKIILCQIQELPETLCQLQYLHTLNLGCCEKLRKMPRDFQRLLSLQTLHLGCCKQLQELPNGFGRLVALQYLNLEYCETLRKLPDDFSQLRSLKYLDLQGCRSLEALPDDFGNLVSLQILSLRYCAKLSMLPTDFGQLCSLKTVMLSWCRSLKVLPDNFGNLVSLQILYLKDCEKLSMLPTDFGNLVSLQDLILTGCKSLEQLPSGFGNLVSLQKLDLQYCDILRKLPDDFSKLRSLKCLDLESCESLEALPGNISNLVSLQILSLKDCEKLSMLPTDFGQLCSLKTLTLSGCESLKELPESFLQMRGLCSLDVTFCPFFNQNLLKQLKQQNVELCVTTS